MNKVERFKQVTEQMVSLYERKNADYGDSFGESFKEFGMTMPLIRLSDKLNRLKRLNKADAQVDESVEDTLIDLANYAVMTLVEMHESAESAAEKIAEKAKKCFTEDIYKDED